MSETTEAGHTELGQKSIHGDDDGTKMTRDGDLERSETPKEGEMLSADAEAAKREWIRTNKASPRNWPLWRKCKLLSPLCNWCSLIDLLRPACCSEDFLVQVFDLLVCNQHRTTAIDSGQHNYLLVSEDLVQDCH